MSLLSFQLLCENAVFVYGPLYIELPEFEIVLVRLLVINIKTVAITANIKINPAMAIAMANLRCDIQIESSGVYNFKNLFNYNLMFVFFY